VLEDVGPILDQRGAFVDRAVVDHLQNPSGAGGEGDRTPASAATSD
jgi:hypothetical protein